MEFRDWLARFDGGLMRTISSREQYLMGKAWEAATDQLGRRWYGVKAKAYTYGHGTHELKPLEPLQYMTIDSIGCSDWTPDHTKAITCATKEQVDTFLIDGDVPYLAIRQ